jgi:hypothetical protein
MPEIHIYNAKIAAKLEEVAAILDTQDANPFRVQAYRRAAQTVRNLNRPLGEIVDESGIEGIDELPGIGETLARLLFQLVKSGRMPMLDRLRGGIDPIAALASVPGVGKKFAAKLHDDLGIESLEELEAAAYDGRLDAIKGFGAKRIAGIRDSLSTRLGRIPKNISGFHNEQPSVAEILDVDREYREKAKDGTLFKIAPRRFNPKHEAWLPILHTVRQGHHYTALFSNTARAHELQKTGDWVVIYYDADTSQRQYTVIDAERGPLAGNRIVRGRESECREYYLAPDHASSSLG